MDVPLGSLQPRIQVNWLIQASINVYKTEAFSFQSVQSLYEGSKKAYFESVVRNCADSDSKKVSSGALYEGLIDQKDKA